MAKAIGIPEYAIRRYAFQADRYYKQFRIPKRNGRSWRSINAPSRSLKGIQRWILYFVLRPRDLHDACIGFRPGRSIASNASPHVSQDFVATLDLKDFFPSVTSARVFGLFRSLGYPDEVSFILTRLCTYRGALAQGAPTSPDIANLVCRKLDVRLGAICRCRSWKYTRYADDLSISGKGSGERARELLEAIVKEEGFEPNPRKSRTCRRGTRQTVTGLVVNDGVSIPRPWRRRLRAMVHQLSIRDKAALSRRHHIEGQLSFLAMVQPDCSLVARGREVLRELDSRDG
jgi:retron-type reverse transcriptase